MTANPATPKPPLISRLTGATTGATLLVALLLIPSIGAARTGPAGQDDLPRITITDPNRNLLALALPDAGGDNRGARQATKMARHSLGVVGLFKILNPVSFPPELHSEGLSFSSALWSQVGAQAVAKMQVTAEGRLTKLQARLYRVGGGEAPVLDQTYKGTNLQSLVHRFVNDLIESLTGIPGIFGSRIVFGRGNKELMSIGADGSQPVEHTRLRSASMLPAFSPDGSLIAFTNFLSRNPDLWVVPTAGGRAYRVSKRPGMNTGATWLPDGRQVIATLSFGGNSELYRIHRRSGKIVAQLTDNAAIDSSPAVSPDGRQVAFVSDRQGTPQIFVMSVKGSAAKRVTYKGAYNQTPAWNPRKDKNEIAFTGRDERGVFDIFTLDLDSKEVTRLTQNKGSNQHPSYSPDGRLVVYASSRGGLFVLNPQTMSEVQIWRGKASSPDWGPATE